MLRSYCSGASRALVRSDELENCKGPLAKWRYHSANVRRAQKMSADFKPWTSSPDPQCAMAGVPRIARVHDLVNCMYVRMAFRAIKEAMSRNRPRPTLKEMCRNHFINLPQAVQRHPLSTGLTCSTQNATWYSLEAGCVLLPEHHLRLQGAPRDVKVGDATPGTVRSLAGQSYSMSSYGPCVLAYTLVSDQVRALFATGSCKTDQRYALHTESNK